MMTISATLHQTMTLRLLNRSARYPAGAASSIVRQHEAGRADGQHGADVERHLAAIDVFLAQADDEPAQDVVVRRAEELRQQQADERERHQPIALDRVARLIKLWLIGNRDAGLDRCMTNRIA